LKASVQYVIAFVVLLAVGGLWLFNNAETGDTLPKQNSTFVFAINDCDAITEKAAANLVAIVEVQKLEIAGRKANVFKTCMKDRGYKENPAWTKYVEPIAAQKAKAEITSIDEAFENLRRAKMILTTPEPDQPVFWVLGK